MTTVYGSPTSESGDWSKPTDAYSPNHVCAIASSGGKYHVYYEYDFNGNIPSDKIIDEVAIIPTHGETQDNYALWIQISWDGGSTWSEWATAQYTGSCFLSGTDVLDASELTDWTPEKLANIRVRVRSYSTGGGTCFIPNTKVTMVTGESKPIKDCDVGLSVLSWRRKLGKCEGKVTGYTYHKFASPSKMMKITPKKGKPLIMAPIHQVCVTKNHMFKLARNLTEKDCLLNENEQLIPILNVEEVGIKEMVNISIDRICFYANGFLVQNIVKTPW